MAAIVGALRIVLGADIAEFEQGFKKASSQLQRASSDFNVAGKAIGTALGGAIGGLAAGVLKATDAMDKLGKESQKLGISTESLSALSLAAKLSDTSVEELTKSFSRLSKGLVESDKATSTQVRALQALGLSVKDFKQLAPEKQMEVLADAFSKTEDGATKLAIGQALLGKSFSNLIPLFNTGAEGLKRAKEEAEAFNLIISGETAKRAENFQDNLTRLQAATQGWFNVLASMLIPRLEQASNEMVKGAVAANGYRDSAEKVGRAMLFFADNQGKFLTVLAALAIIITPISLKLKLLISTIILLGEVFKAAAPDNVKEQWTNVLKEFGFNTDALTKSTSELQKGIAKLDAEIEKKKRTFITEEDARKAEEFRKKIDEVGLQTAETSGKFSGVFAPGLAQTAVQMKLVTADFFKFDKTVGLIPPKVLELNKAMFELRAANITQETLTPWEEFHQKMVQLNADFNNSSLSAEAFGRKAAKIASELQSSYATAAAGLAGSFGTAFQAIGGENESWARAAKIAMATQALLSTYAASAQALNAGIPPFNFIAAAAVLAHGLALVAAIKGTPLGFQTGGQFKVGGSGGIDSKLVQFMATPGEVVQVHKGPPDSAPGAIARPRQSVNIHMKGERFSRREVEQLIMEIDKVTRDGARLTVAPR